MNNSKVSEDCNNIKQESSYNTKHQQVVIDVTENRIPNTNRHSISRPLDHCYNLAAELKYGGISKISVPQYFFGFIFHLNIHCGPSLELPYQAVLMRGHKVCFNGEIKEFISEPLLIWSLVKTNRYVPINLG